MHLGNCVLNERVNYQLEVSEVNILKKNFSGKSFVITDEKNFNEKKTFGLAVHAENVQMMQVARDLRSNSHS